MRDHIRREGAQEISAAWFVIPMSLAAAVLMAMGSEPLSVDPAPAQQASPVIAAPPAARSDEPLPEGNDHVQAF
jgi:hypothetical protein